MLKFHLFPWDLEKMPSSGISKTALGPRLLRSLRPSGSFGYALGRHLFQNPSEKGGISAHNPPSVLCLCVQSILGNSKSCVYLRASETICLGRRLSRVCLDLGLRMSRAYFSYTSNSSASAESTCRSEFCSWSSQRSFLLPASTFGN